MDRMLQAKLDQDPALHAATEWFFELRTSDVPPERINEWQQWLTADARNRKAFERVESFWRMDSQAVSARWPTEAEVSGDAYDGEISISQWRQSPASGRHGLARRKPLHLALAAGLAVAAAALGWVALERWSPLQALLSGESRLTVNTAVGEKYALRLSDGSVLDAGGDTAIVVRFGSRSREVRLERGEAFFHVAKDAARPFTVQAGHATVTAVGTAFNVRKSQERVVVAVSEGAVRVITPTPSAGSGDTSSPPGRLEAGQQLSVESAGKTLEVSPVDTASVAGWRQGRLQYLNEPLETVVADLARYSTRDIRIDDAGVAGLRVTGIVFEQNIDGWLASLQATFPVAVIRGQNGQVTLKSIADRGGVRH